MAPRYPDIRVELAGHDHSEYGPLARCLGAMTRAGLSSVEQGRFTREATAGDYSTFLRVSAKWLALLE